MIKLYLSMDKIRIRYGSDAIHRASGVEKKVASLSVQSQMS